MQAYCVKCRAKKEMKDAKAITMKNGKPATQGVCPTCGTKMFRIGKSQSRYYRYQKLYLRGWVSLLDLPGLFVLHYTKCNKVTAEEGVYSLIEKTTSHTRTLQ